MARFSIHVRAPEVPGDPLVFHMNILPLNSSANGAPKDDSLLLVNMDHVRLITRNIYFPEASKDGVEGSRLYMHGVPKAESYSVDVKETRVEILRMLEGPGKHSCQRNHNQPEKSHV